MSPNDECTISINFNDYNYKIQKNDYFCRLQLKESEKNNFSNYFDIKIKVENYSENQVKKFKEKYYFILYGKNYNLQEMLEKNNFDMEKTYDEIMNHY